MATRRRLEVGSDGMADVMILTNPIPRHISIVSWGANDAPAQSWKSASQEASAQQILRSFPAESVKIDNLALTHIQAFVKETMDAWVAACADVLRNPLRSADRGAQIQALTVQAGARIAAYSTALSSRLGPATKTYKSQGLTLPKVRTATTLQGEIDRRNYMTGLTEATAALTDNIITMMKNPSTTISVTEGVLNMFAEAGHFFSSWAASWPDGVVGAATAEVPVDSKKGSGTTDTGGVIPHEHEYTTGDNRTGSVVGALGDVEPHSHPVNPGTLYTGLAGKRPHRHKIPESLAWLPQKNTSHPTSTENAMNFTITDLQRLAEDNPVGFITAIKTAIESAKQRAPEVAQKLAWGDTGVEQHNVSDILSTLGSMEGGEMIMRMIAGAVSGIDVNNRAQMDNTQVASAMKSGMVKYVISEISENPDGELSSAIKSALAKDIAEAVSESMKMVLNSMQTGDEGGPFGFGNFEVPENDDPLAAAIPSAGRSGFVRG